MSYYYRNQYIVKPKNELKIKEISIKSSIFVKTETEYLNIMMSLQLPILTLFPKKLQPPLSVI